MTSPKIICTAGIPACQPQECMMPKQDNPQTHVNFNAPLGVVADPSLSMPEKTKALEDLEQDAR